MHVAHPIYPCPFGTSNAGRGIHRPSGRVRMSSIIARRLPAEYAPRAHDTAAFPSRMIGHARASCCRRKPAAPQHPRRARRADRAHRARRGRQRPARRAAAALPARLLPRRGGRGPRRAHAAAARQGGARAPRLRGAARTGPFAGTGVQPRCASGRLRVRSYPGAHGHRRHAVPGGLPRHGLQPRGARRAPDRAPGAASAPRPPRAPH